MLVLVHYLVVLGGALYLVGVQTTTPISAAASFGIAALVGLINSFVGYQMVGRPRLKLRGFLTMEGLYVYLPIVFVVSFSLMLGTLQVVHDIKRASSGISWTLLLSMGLNLLLLGLVVAGFAKRDSKPRDEAQA